MTLVLLDFSEVGSIRNKHKMSVRRLVLDPGHGGKDPGAIGKFSMEKDIVLEVSLLAGKMIERFCPDVEVIYTRKSDEFVELHRRAQIANEKNSDLFISVHCNASKKQEANGFEVFVMGLDKTEKNLEVAKLENASILLEDNYEQIYGGIDPNSSEAYIIFSLYQHAFLEQSLIFADKLTNAFQTYVQLNIRPIKQAPFLVLWRTTMPSVLVELAFISHPEEEKFLNSDVGKKKMAYAIYHSFVSYKNAIEKNTLQIVDFKTATGIEFRYLSNLQNNDQFNVIEQNNNLKQPIQNHNEIIVTENSSVAQIYFAVQVHVDKELLPPNTPKFKGVDSITYYFHNNLYKYIYGKTQDYDEALKYQREMRERGFRDAFIIALNNGERIDLNTARKLLKKNEK